MYVFKLELGIICRRMNVVRCNFGLSVLCFECNSPLFSALEKAFCRKVDFGSKLFEDVHDHQKWHIQLYDIGFEC